jgi:hypothetical protein
MKQRHNSASAGRLPERMAGGLFPINASPAPAGRVTRGAATRRDELRKVARRVFMIDSPIPRQHADGRRPVTQTVLQRPDTSQTSTAVKSPGAPVRAADDTLDCSGLADFFSNGPIGQAANAGGDPNVGLITTPAAHPG